MSTATVVGVGPAAVALAASARAAGFAVSSDPAGASVPAQTTRVLVASEGMARETLVELILDLVSRQKPVWVDLTESPDIADMLPCERVGERAGVRLRAPAASPLPRALDIAVAAVSLIALSPLLLVLAALIKLTSPGPVFHRAIVVGQDGRPFTWYKFRTMQVAGEDESERQRRFTDFVAGGAAPTKIVDDSRVTRVGRILRRHSLDELPQLLSVLMGHMTLIGPRPCLVYEYELLKPWHRRRFTVRPGLTGLWQVRGRGRVHADEMAFMDIVYSLGRTWRSDMRVLWATVAVVLSGRGAT